MSRPSFDIDSIHDFIIKQVIAKKVLAPFLAPKKSHKGYYPVVIGGINIVRCAKTFPKAYQLITNLYSNDIDVKYMVIDPIADLKAPVLQQAHKERMHFLNGVLKSKEFKEILGKAATRLSPLVSLAIDAEVKEQLDHPVEGIRMAMRAVLRLEYKVQQLDQADSVVVNKVLVDTGMFSNVAKGGVYFAYRKLFPTPNNIPVPFSMYKGVPVATCGWTYFDTVRMLVYYADEWNKALEGKDAAKRTFVFSNYLKYMAKFTVLFITMKQINNIPEYKVLRELYTVSQKSIAKMNVGKETRSKDISEEQKGLLDALVKIVGGRTNMRKVSYLLAHPTPMRKPINISLRPVM